MPERTFNVNHQVKSGAGVAVALLVTALVCLCVLNSRSQASGRGIPATIRGVTMLHGKETRGIAKITLYVDPEYADRVRGLDGRVTVE